MDTLLVFSESESPSDQVRNSDEPSTLVSVMWALGMGLAMCTIALVGVFSLFLPMSTTKKFIRPLVAFSSGALIGGAFFHMLPSSVSSLNKDVTPYVLCVAGFVVFLLIEETVHWFYNHKEPVTSAPPQPAPEETDVGKDVEAASPSPSSTVQLTELPQCPGTRCNAARQCEAKECACPSHHVDRSKLAMGWVILLGDGLHNFFGGISIGATFAGSASAGWSSWVAAALHELPQELGDFAVLVHAGMPAKKALMSNFIAALPFLAGTLLSVGIGKSACKYFVPFGAGNFIYIGATTLLPEVHHQTELKNILSFVLPFVLGLVVLLCVRLIFAGW